jgi:hypothetical protein
MATTPYRWVFVAPSISVDGGSTDAGGTVTFTPGVAFESPFGSDQNARVVLNVGAPCTFTLVGGTGVWDAGSTAIVADQTSTQTVVDLFNRIPWSADRTYRFNYICGK